MNFGERSRSSAVFSAPPVEYAPLRPCIDIWWVLDSTEHRTPSIGSFPLLFFFFFEGAVWVRYWLPVENAANGPAINVPRAFLKGLMASVLDAFSGVGSLRLFFFLLLLLLLFLLIDWLIVTMLWMEWNCG